jgi:hypothetical protein
MNKKGDIFAIKTANITFQKPSWTDLVKSEE